MLIFTYLLYKTVLNIYFVSVSDDCYLPRLLALGELASSQLLRNMGRHMEGGSWIVTGAELILFLRVWPVAQTPSRSLFLFPSPQRPGGKLPPWWNDGEVGSFGQEPCLSLLLSCSEGVTGCPVVGYEWSRWGQPCSSFQRQNYPSLFALGLWLRTREIANYIPYFHLLSELKCVVWKSWFKNTLALRYFKGIALKDDTRGAPRWRPCPCCILSSIHASRAHLLSIGYMLDIV